MKNATRLILFSLIFSILCLPLGGCIKTFDCSGYIQSMLDATYKGELEGYAKATKSDLSDIEEDYRQFIEHETEILLHFCGLTKDDMIPDDLVVQLREIVENMCKQVRYSVKEADRNGNVDIDIEPLDIYNSVYKEFLDFNTQFTERNNNYEFEDYTDEEFTRAYLEPLISILKKQQDQLSYREPVTVKVVVAPDDDGRYTISNEEVTQIYNTMINYTIDSAK
ncbi:MAG: hypothetical protein KHX56_10460 [Clostridiales bacterium]|nr:hypothetical protein [Clostridiales bacterium]